MNGVTTHLPTNLWSPDTFPSSDKKEANGMMHIFVFPFKCSYGNATNGWIVAMVYLHNHTPSFWPERMPTKTISNDHHRCMTAEVMVMFVTKTQLVYFSECEFWLQFYREIVDRREPRWLSGRVLSFFSGSKVPGSRALLKKRRQRTLWSVTKCYVWLGISYFFRLRLMHRIVK